MNTGLREILTTRLWNMLPSVLHNYRAVIENNINSSVPLDFADEPDSFLCCKSQGFENTLIAGDADMIFDYCDIAADDEVINVICVNGPVTRNGDGCSIGSKQQRDKVLRATRMPQVVGHLFMIDTPGGSAFSKNDYSQAIEAAHEAGQPVLALIDGMCCSAGMALASLCDEIYYVHGNDEVGCIGTMAAFYSNKNGDVHTISQETYHELYDPESFEKNLEFRKCAEGDDSMIIEELRKDGEEFRGMVKAHRPNATEEHLHGKVFKAGEVEGILVDGKSDFNGCVARILELAHAPKENPSEVIPDPAPAINPEDPSSASVIVPEESSSASTPSNTQTPVSDASPSDNNTIKEMKVYENINAALEVEELAVAKDGSFYCDSTLAEKLEAKLAEAQKNSDILEANVETVASLNAKVAELKAQAEQSATTHTEEKTALETEVANLKSQLSEATVSAESSAASIAEFGTKVSDLESQLATLTEEKAALEATLAEKQAEIEELAKASAPAATPAPASVQEPETKEDSRSLVQTIYSETMTPEEKAAAREARMAYLKSIR